MGASKEAPPHYSIAMSRSMSWGMSRYDASLRCIRSLKPIFIESLNIDSEFEERVALTVTRDDVKFPGE